MREMIRRVERNAEKNREDEEDARAKDHRLDFGLFNTMLARC
jgi:hypothetical protein